jgi:putative flavoprotein involved in K+ transport
MSHSFRGERIHTLVIGGGQAGLSVGYHLAQRKLPFLILDASRRIGDAWRNRWDSLRLFTPARYCGLPGLPFPATGGSFPTKQQMADYLESYAQRFRLPVQNNTRIESLSREGDRFVAAAGGQTFQADHVVVAMANYQDPRVPAFAAQLDHQIVQLHSHAYRNPAQLQEGAVLVVGAGNSAADIAIEIVRTHPTWMSGAESGHIPWPIDSFVARNLLFRFIRFLGHHILTVKTPIGRKVRPKMLSQATPLVRVKPRDLVAAGVQRVARVIGVCNGKPLLADDLIIDVRNVIWCTGYRPSFSWIKLPIFDPQGQPVHDCGIVDRVPGMYFVGLHYLYAMSSATIIGVSRDAERVVKAIAARSPVALAA